MAEILDRSGNATTTAIAQHDLHALASDLYQYAYPLVLMDVTMRQSTAVSDASSVPGRAPINQFAHFRSYPNAEAKDVVRFNFDTLYSFAWADLSAGPVILSVPDTAGRFYLIPSLDMWTDVFCSLGPRTTGTGAGHFAYVAPGWEGDLPEGVTRINAPTSLVWLMGRVQTNGPSDYANVHLVQDGLILTPLSEWGRAYTPPRLPPPDTGLDAETPPLVQVGAMSGVELLTRFAELLRSFPPHPNDYPILLRMRALGLVAGESWNAATLDASTIALINDGAKAAMADLIAGVKTDAKQVNGWNVFTDNMGCYGTSYRRRAIVALAGLGANLPEDAIYPTAFLDTHGDPLDSAKAYVLHFDAGRTPPANAFWSITMYDFQGFQVPNALNRYAIGDRDALKFNPDGSLDLFLQPESPGPERESNWLPSAKHGEMGPTMRLYSPRADALSGTWEPPGLRRRDLIR